MPKGPSQRSRQLAQLLLEALQNSKLLSEEQLKSMIADNYSDLNVSDVGDVLEKGTSFGAFRRIRGKYQLGGVMMMPCGTMGKGRGRRGRSPSKDRRRTRRTTKRRVGSRRRRTPARRRRMARKRSQADGVDAPNDSGDAAQNPK